MLFPSKPATAIKDLFYRMSYASQDVRQNRQTQLGIIKAFTAFRKCVAAIPALDCPFVVVIILEKSL